MFRNLVSQLLNNDIRALGVDVAPPGQPSKID